jgi:hypothetical protein
VRGAPTIVSGAHEVERRDAEGGGAEVSASGGRCG